MTVSDLTNFRLFESLPEEGRWLDLRDVYAYLGDLYNKPGSTRMALGFYLPAFYLDMIGVTNEGTFNTEEKAVRLDLLRKLKDFIHEYSLPSDDMKERFITLVSILLHELPDNLPSAENIWNKSAREILYQ